MFRATLLLGVAWPEYKSIPVSVITVLASPLFPRVNVSPANVALTLPPSLSWRPLEFTTNWSSVLAPFKVTPVFSNEALTVVLSLIVKPLVFNKRCSAPVLPIVVVEANLAAPAPLWLMTNPSALNTALLLAFLIIFTSSVDADMWAPAVLPKVAPCVLNLPTTVEESFNVNPDESILKCSLEVSPKSITPLAIAKVSVPASRSVIPLEFIVILSSELPITVVPANWATCAPPCVTVRPLASITALLFESCMMSTESLSILTCSALALPTVVVAPKEAKVVSEPPPLFTIKSTESSSIKTLDLPAAFCPTVTVVPYVAKVTLASSFSNDIPLESNCTWVW